MPIRVDARIRRDRKTWSIYYSLFQYRRCDRQSVDVEKQCSRFILSKGIFVHFLHYLTQKRIKNVIPQTTPLRRRTILRSLDKRSILSLGASSSSFPFFVVAFLFSRRALSLMVCCASSFYISLSKGRNFFILMVIPEPRARAMMPRAARPSSNAKHSRRRPQRRDIALFRRLALTPKAFLKTEDKRARLERRI